MGLSVNTFVDGSLNEMELGGAERDIRNDPTSKVAVMYFSHVRLLANGTCFLPLVSGKRRVFMEDG